MTLRENIELHIAKISDARKEQYKPIINDLYKQADLIDQMQDRNKMIKASETVMKAVKRICDTDSVLKDLFNPKKK